MQEVNCLIAVNIGLQQFIKQIPIFITGQSAPLMAQPIIGETNIIMGGL